MTPDTLDRLEQLEREATPGPWADGERESNCIAEANGKGFVVLRRTNNDTMPSRPNMELITAMRNALPALLASARTLQTIRQMRPELSRMVCVTDENSDTLKRLLALLADGAEADNGE